MESKIVKLDPSVIITTIQNSKDPAECILNLHRLVVSDFDKREKLNGYVYCNQSTWKFIAKHFLDKMRPSQGMSIGFLWMNHGFSGSAVGLQDFEFDISNV